MVSPQILLSGICGLHMPFVPGGLQLPFVPGGACAPAACGVLQVQHGLPSGMCGPDLAEDILGHVQPFVPLSYHCPPHARI